MFYISVLIDNRKYQVVALVPENTTGQKEEEIPSFIIQRNPGEERTIFSIATDAQIIFKGGFSNDTAIDWGQLRSELSGSELILEIFSAQKSKSLSEITTSISSELRIKNDFGKYSFGVSGHYQGRKITVALKFTINNKLYVGKFIINLAPQKQIFDVVMDFGSEASQIIMHQRGGNEIMRRTEIVNELLKYYYPQLQNSALHQKVDDKELYSSQFFARKSGAIFDPLAHAGKHGDEELLNLLTDKKSVYDLADTHMFVSNLKLAHLGAYPQRIVFKSTDSNFYEAEHKKFDEIVLDLQQAVINYFIQMVLEDLRRSQRQGSQFYIAIRLLVPNVFDQQKVSLLVKKTYQSLAHISKQNTEYPLDGWEVSTISESDASFLGFKREKEAESRKTGKPYWVTDKDYLIIDAGKGTIDFSILRLSKINNLTSIFRSGFIGAGNVISYAFVDTVFTALFGIAKEQRQKAIYSVCLAPHADMVAKIAFMEIIEQFKKHYDHAKNTRYKSISELVPAEILADIRTEYKENPSAPTLLNQMVDALKILQKKQNSLKDEFGLIFDTVDALVNKIADEVRYSGFYEAERIEKIILTGRGFKFRRLEKAIAEKLKIAVDTTPDLKKICLLGAFSGDRINFDSNLVGYPTMYRFVRTASNHQVKEINAGDSRPVVIIPVRDNFFQKIKTYSTQVIEVINEANRKAQELLSNDDEDEFGERMTEFATESQKQTAWPERFFLYGEYFNNFSRDSQTVTVCGLDYKNHNIGKGRVNVFFTGDEFIIRSENDYSSLGVYPRFFEETQWVFQTLYPFIEVSGPSDVKIVKDFQDDVEMDEF